MYSQYNESEILKDILDSAENNFDSNIIIDIGSHDGVTNSNVADLIKFEKRDFQIYFFEANKKRSKKIKKNYSKINNINIINEIVSEKNIIGLFQFYEISKKILILTIDIDGDDLKVAEMLLKNNYEFSIIIIEYNPTFGTEFEFINPTNLRFGNSYFSIKKTFEKYEMKLVASTPCNMIFVHKDFKFLSHNFDKIKSVINYGFGYDGTLIQMNIDSNNKHSNNYSEFFISPWTGLFIKQPIHKYFRNYEINIFKKYFYNILFISKNLMNLLFHKFFSNKKRARRDLNP